MGLIGLMELLGLLGLLKLMRLLGLMINLIELMSLLGLLIELIYIGRSICHDRIYWLQNSRLLRWSQKSVVLDISFKITEKVNIRDANKLLFVLMSDYRKYI